MRHTAIAALVCWASVTAASILTGAEAGLLRTAQSDRASVSAQALEANPSKAEPMMLGPTRAQDADEYRRDYLACESRGGESRDVCRATVDRQYRPEVTNLSGECEGLDATSKAECLKSRGSGR